MERLSHHVYNLVLAHHPLKRRMLVLFQWKKKAWYADGGFLSEMMKKENGQKRRQWRIEDDILIMMWLSDDPHLSEKKQNLDIVVDTSFGLTVVACIVHGAQDHSDHLP